MHGVGLASFKDRHIVRHSLVRRLLNRYKDNFQIIDNVSAEKTISMWINDEINIQSETDGSIKNFNYKLNK